MIRLLALVQKEEGRHPSQRFRLEQWAPHLARDHGISMDFAPFESTALSDVLYKRGETPRKIALMLRDGIRRLAVIPRARGYDGVVVMREATMLGGAYIERAIARIVARPLIYDFDDAIWSVQASASNGIMSLARMPWKTKSIARLAAAVTVGNDYLAEYARAVSDDVSIVRTSVDLDRFIVAAPPPADAPFTIVWTGSHSTLAHLEDVRGAIERVALQRPTVLRVICDVKPAEFTHARLEFIPWSPAVEATALGAGHVGIMPLPDTMEARGKCGCKALQYMAVGRPAIVSPVGINAAIVEHGINGLHATTEDEWVDALLALATDGDLRHRMGVAGRATVEGEYSASAAAAAFAVVVRRVMSRTRES